MTPQTGKQVMEQVRETLERWPKGFMPYLDRLPVEALAALDGCIVLTAGEAEKVRELWEAADRFRRPFPTDADRQRLQIAARDVFTANLHWANDA